MEPTQKPDVISSDVTLSSQANGPASSREKKNPGVSPSRFFLFSSENKILLLIILIISVLFVALASFIYSRYQEKLDENYNNFGQLIASVLSAGSVERLQSPLSPELKLQTFVDDMLTVNEDIVAIEIDDASGKKLYEGQKDLPESTIENAMDFVAPMRTKAVGEESRVIGQVHVRMSGKTRQDIASATKYIILIIMLSAYLLTIFAVSVNTYVLSKHLKALVRGVKRLSTGDFGYKISEHDLWGELKNLAASFNDMSVRLRAYEDQNLDTITFERNKMEAVLLSIADGILVCNNKGEMTILNDSACKMLGVKTSHVLLGTNLKDYITVEGKKCFEPVVEEFEEICSEHSGSLPETFSRTVKMPEISLKVILSPIHDTDGNNLGFVMTMHDVTKEMRVDKLKTDFISNVSHELRTPVTTIKSYIDTIYNHGEDLDKQTYGEFIETIHVETDRLKKLVNDILDFSRLEEGGVELELEYLDVTPIINLTVQSVKVLAEQKNLTISTAIESNLPKVHINSDTIERVMRNLLSNAIKYTPEAGRIKVRAELAEDGDVLEVSVQDTGIGIPEEHLPHIFDRFYRVENQVHTVKGTGLGLHLVKIAIENHHYGEVFVKSEVDQGSTFGFRLPLALPEKTPEKSIIGRRNKAGAAKEA